MGLAMVQGIAQRHGATVELESKLGKGTTFRFRFPAADTQQIEQPAPVSAGAGTLDILVLDDEPIIAELIGELLAQDGHRVATQIDPKEALKAIVTDPIDLIITDKSMPTMDGTEFAVLAKAASPGVRVLLVTGFGAEEDAGACVDHTIGKPLDLDSLRQGIAEAFGMTTSRAA
jgi:DNA-binding NtrC family response regulator